MKELELSRRFEKLWLPLLVLAVASGCSSCHRAPNEASPDQNMPKSATQQLVRVEAAEEKSCREFVQSFYDWYFGRLTQEGKEISAAGGYDDVLHLKPEVLAPRLRRMLMDDRQASSRNRDAIVGLDFDPYFNAQDWDGKYWVQSVTLKNSACRASVWGTDAGRKREIVDPELEFIGDRWVFVNFHYPDASSSQDENLIDLLNGLRVGRKQRRKFVER